MIERLIHRWERGLAERTTDRMADSRRRLLISARYDLSFPFELSQLLFDECDRNGVNFDRSVVPWGHYTMGEAPFKYDGYLIVNYLRKHL